MGNEQARQVERYTYPSGNVYSGTMIGTKRHGEGSLTWVDGGVYTGGWENDQCQGFGKMRFPNGSVYEGNFVRNNPYGQGKLTTNNGEVLSGFWEFHGRSDQARTPVGKYQFHGELVDTKTGQRTALHGPLALYLQSGLVSLPNMPDPAQSMFPYALAFVENDKDAMSNPALAEGGKALFQQAMNNDVPVAYAVGTAPTSSTSVSYGQHEPALQEKHPDDHVAYSLLDPRLYLGSLGFPTQPTNINHAKQQAIRQQQQVGGAVPVAVPIQAIPSANGPGVPAVQAVPARPQTQPVVFM
jgi:hypothetical protein